MKINSCCLYFATVLAVCFTVQDEAKAATESLNWNWQGQKGITCIYGEVTVLTSIKRIYFCGAQWGGVDGYCGIQDLDNDRRMICSIWDTSPTLHPKVTEADPQTAFLRFDGEGNGAHTHMLWDWKLDETFRYFLQKRPGKQSGTSDTCFYVFDSAKKKWRHIATINSPNGPNNTGAIFEGAVSWIENICGEADRATPKVALYGMWIGPSPDKLKHVTRSNGESGSGRWGQLQGQYFLAEAGEKQLARFFSDNKKKYGEPTFGQDGRELPPIAENPLPPRVVEELKSLPHAPATTNAAKADNQ